MGYTEIREAAEAHRAERRATREQMVDRHQAELESIDSELEASQAAIETLWELEQNFGDGQSHADAEEETPPPSSKKAPPTLPAPPPPRTPARGGGAPAPKRRRQSASEFRALAKAAILEAFPKVVDDDGWAKTKPLGDASGVKRQTFLRAMRELIEDGTVEKKGATATLLYRLVTKGEQKTSVAGGPPPGRSTAPPPAPPRKPPAAPPATPPSEPPVGGLRGRVLDFVDRHEHPTDNDVALGLGRGTKNGKGEVTRILENLQDEGRLAYDVDGVDRRWRFPTAAPIKAGAAVQTKPGEVSSGTANSELERRILHTVGTGRDGARSIDEIIAALAADDDPTPVSKDSTWRVVNSLLGHKLLIRGIRGQVTVFGKPPK